MSEEKNESQLSFDFNKPESPDPFQEYLEKKRKEREQMTLEELLNEVEYLTAIGKLPSMADSNDKASEKDLSKEDILQIAKEFYLSGVDFRIDDQPIQNGPEGMYRTWKDQEVWCIYVSDSNLYGLFSSQVIIVSKTGKILGYGSANDEG